MGITGQLEELWRQQSLWSQTADRLKQRITRARAGALSIIVGVSILGAASALLADSAPVASRVTAAAAAFFVAMLPLLRPSWSGRLLRDWTRARSVSEALKSEVFLSLARAGDYRDDKIGTLLRDKTGKILNDGGDLSRYQVGLTPAQRDLPAVHDLESYFRVRVDSQISSYYRPSALALQLVLRRFRVGEVALAMAAALVGIAAATVGGSTWTPWIAVSTTITAAVAVHVAAARHEYQLIEFLRTAGRLEQLQSKANDATDPAELDALALAAEDVMSIQNEGWMAKLADDPPIHRIAE